MLVVTKQRKTENGETLSVVKAEVTIYPYMSLAEGTVLTRFTIKVIKIHEVLLSSLFIFRIPASGTGF